MRFKEVREWVSGHTDTKWQCGNWEMVDGTTDSMDMNLRKLWEIVKDWGACSPWGCSQTRFSN